MKISEARISHLAHLILDGLRRDGLVACREDSLALRAVKEALGRQLAPETEVDALVRQKLHRQNQVPGSREWQVLYDRYFREEMSRRR